LGVPRETTTAAERFSLRSISAFTQTPGSHLGSAIGFRLSWSQLLIRHLIGAPSPSYCKKNSSVTFGKSRSSNEACKLFTRSMGASSSLFVYECCAHSEQLKSTSMRLEILVSISLLDTPCAKPISFRVWPGCQLCAFADQRWDSAATQKKIFSAFSAAVLRVLCVLRLSSADHRLLLVYPRKKHLRVLRVSFAHFAVKHFFDRCSYIAPSA